MGGVGGAAPPGRIDRPDISDYTGHMKKTTKVTKRRGGPAKVSELKASLSQYLARVKSGEEVVITEHGRPIAKLVPLQQVAAADADRLRELERRGLISVGRGRVSERLWKLPPGEDPTASVRKALLEERETGP